MLWTGRDEGRWLGWLDEPKRGEQEVDALAELADGVAGLTDDVVLLGMGGSSLAPEVLRVALNANRFHVLDTTHPRAIRELEARIDPGRTLFVVASKSGSTLETRSHAEYFWSRVPKGDKWIAITDPGSDLERLARERGFRAVISGEPTIGGRYSALSPFGLVPASLMGMDVMRLLVRTREMSDATRGVVGNPALDLGLALGEGWHEGRDKVCISGNAGSFGLWAEQLLAESTGKLGKGLIPAPGVTGAGSDRQHHTVDIADPYELGQEFFKWEFATAVAGALLGINPFDQPDVQAAKDRTNEVLKAGDAALEMEGSIAEIAELAAPGDYIAIQGFIDPTEAVTERLWSVARSLEQRTGCVPTVGIGPRYLHSTGQLHKGGPNTGLFIQVLDDVGDELPIPGQPFGFGRLIRAQAAGDFASLKERGRRVVRVHLNDLEEVS